MVINDPYPCPCLLTCTLYIYNWELRFLYFNDILGDFGIDLLDLKQLIVILQECCLGHSIFCCKLQTPELLFYYIYNIL